MMFPESASAKAVDKEWHKFRQSAREDAFSLGAFSNNDIIRYNLNTAGITGEDNPRTYTFTRQLDVFGRNGIDIRDLRDR
ncbi:hypothetical protein 7908G4C8_33 [Haloquadratum phage sp.]|nr:hypothetical protein 7908G4C8_33 [Haloquadratum phage sp.]